MDDQIVLAEAQKNQQWYLNRQAEDRNRSPWFRYIKYPDQYSEVVLITPRMAEALLSNNGSGQRPDNAVVYQLVKDFQTGNCPSHEAISVSEEGKLLDGVQRLLAVIRSEMDVPLFIVFNLPNRS